MGTGCGRTGEDAITNDIETVAGWIADSASAIVFTGAGISTESGIPDFRSPNGIWATSQPVYFDDFLKSPKARHEYWRQKSVSHRDFANARPNLGHQLVARWETRGKVAGVITQNIDGLHQEAGSTKVLELHGTARCVACLSCDFREEADRWVSQFAETKSVPDCPRCGGLLKHATISFGQNLDPGVLDEAVQWSRQCELFLALGSSLVVEPAASLPRMAKSQGARLVIVNRDETGLDTMADRVLHEPIGQTLEAIEMALSRR